MLQAGQAHDAVDLIGADPRSHGSVRRIQDPPGDQAGLPHARHLLSRPDWDCARATDLSDSAWPLQVARKEAVHGGALMLCCLLSISLVGMPVSA